jgi:hypothetical protein
MRRIAFCAVVLATAVSWGGIAQEKTTTISFQKDVTPILKKYCLPCHDEDNKSKLSMESYELLIKGGKHGPPIVGGEPEKSILLRKLSDTPPFGEQMPLARRRKSPGSRKELTKEEFQVLYNWIKQGALDN